MYFVKEALAANTRLQSHWGELWSNRNMFNVNQAMMVKNMRSAMTPELLAANAVAGLGRDFWAEIDKAVVESRQRETGMEIVNDLMSVQTVLPVGKTAKLYNIAGGIADDVSITLDGQAPFSYDQTDYASDGDPIPVFSAGYGVNWREAEGMSTVGIDLVLDSQKAKLVKYNKAIVKYALDGNANIRVQSYAGQGLRNHRNTYKIDLNGGTNLTTANMADLLAFFGSGAFGAAARLNKIDAYDVLWVSPEIWANLSQANIVNGSVVGSVMDQVSKFAPVKEFRMSYALSGNEFLGYVRDRNSVSPLIGMATGVTPLPRPMPNSNFNFQVLGAMGIQVIKDSEGSSGVVYGAKLT